MILYATKQTVERYKLKLPSELTSPLDGLAKAVIQKESGDNLLEWGVKLFYFDKRKCIQVVNFASKFTLFLIDVKVDDLPEIGNMIAKYLLKLYEDDEIMIKSLEKMFVESPGVCFEKLTDKSAIATLNFTQLRFLDDGYRLYEFIDNGILHTLEVNRLVNFSWLFTMKINEKTEYIYAGERFRELVTERFSI